MNVQMFVFLQFCCLAIVSIAKCATISPRQEPEPVEVEFEDSYQIRKKPADNLELPRFESAAVPFYSPEPSTDLRAPSFSDNSQPNYYQVPIPAQELVAPIETAWNPNNDPKFYYEVPAILSKQELPTNSFPKKYNKQIHSKEKPFSSKPKQEIALEPIYEQAYIRKQKELHKLMDKLAKEENRKQLIQQQAEKVQNEPLGAATGFTSGFDSEGLLHHQSSSNNGFNRGLSADITATLGIPTAAHASNSNQERLVFHMVGHDGPHSYKWGYDTGKG